MEQDDNISLPWSQVSIRSDQTGYTDQETPDSRVHLRFPDGRATNSLASTPLTLTTTETATPSTIGTISSIGSNRSLGTVNEHLEHLFVNPPTIATPAPTQTPAQSRVRPREGQSSGRERSRARMGESPPSARLDFDN